MCILIHFRYVSCSFAVVVFFIPMSENKRSPGTDFTVEDIREGKYSSDIRLYTL